MSLKILIVEDEPLIAVTIETALEKQGYQVIGDADSFASAIEFLGQRQADLVLLDIKLEGDQDGIELAQELDKRAIPYLFLTSQTDPNTKDRIKEVRYQEGTTAAPSSSSDDIFTDGNVGIGTSTVNYPLDIDASSTRTIDLENTGNGFIYGLYNRINEAAPSASVTNTYGILNSITRTNQSAISGVSNSFSNSVSTASFGYLFGVDNSFGTSTSSLSIGFFNRFQGTTTTAVGMRNLVAGSFTDFYGVQNYNITGGHNGTFYGLYNFFGASGGNGTRYGAFTEFFDTGIGNKYGYYVDIADSAGGTHYGIYSSALKTGSYAGYFLGDVAIGTTTANNYTFPASRGTNGQVMVTDTAGNLSWTTLSGLESTTASNGLSESADDI